MGIGNLKIKNLVLLYKWWWKFSTENNRLWQRVVKSTNQISTLEPSCDSQKEVISHTLKAPVNACKEFPWLKVVLENGVKKQLGNGDTIKFWWDLWIGNELLMKSFPRLYSISNQKHCVIADMGIWNNDVWEWSLNWRRSLFAWENQKLDVLLNLINSNQPSASKTDTSTWLYTD